MRKSGVKQVIFDVWEAHLDWSPKDIRGEVHERLSPKRSRNKTYPGLRLVQLYTKEFRDNLGQLVDEDKPWSIAASSRYGISPEASKDLFDIWRFSLAIDRPISIRQAKWIVYIRNLFYQPISTGNRYSDKVNRNLWLIGQSWLYSILERASRIMGEQNFDTTDLDAASFMLNWEHATAVKLGIVSQVKYSQEALTKIERYGTSLTSPSYSITSVEQAVWHNVRKEPPRDLEIMELGLGEKALPEEADLVCAYWLNYLSKGPKWKFLDYLEQKKVRLKVLEGVKKCSELLNKTSPIPTPFEPSASEIIKNLEINPDILKIVGYDVPDTNNIKQKTEGGTS